MNKIREYFLINYKKSNNYKNNNNKILRYYLTCVWNRSMLDGLGYDGPVE